MSKKAINLFFSFNLSAWIFFLLFTLYNQVYSLLAQSFAVVMVIYLLGWVWSLEEEKNKREV